MKLRNFIPWVPIIGIFMVLSWPVRDYIDNYKGKYPLASHDGFVEYIWGSWLLFGLSSFYQGLVAFILILILMA